MRHHPPLRTLAACLLSVYSSGAFAQSPAFHASIDLVTVSIRAVDAQGHPVHELSAEDFRLTEDGHLQTIVTFEYIESPLPPALVRATPGRRSLAARASTGPGRQYVLLVYDVRLK